MIWLFLQEKASPYNMIIKRFLKGLEWYNMTKNTFIAAFAMAILVGSGLLFGTLQSGAVKNFHGEEIVSFNENDPTDGFAPEEIEPAAGGIVSDAQACGDTYGYIGKSVDEAGLSGSYRILPPHQMMEQGDYKPKRLNLHVDDNGMIEDAVCG